MQYMASVESDFTPLEQAVLRAICEAHFEDRIALEAQLSTATVLSRENTGAGSYTRFSVNRSSGPAIAGERRRPGPSARINGLEHGMGFILWLNEGYAECLEAYSYGENTTAIPLEQVGFEILQG
ncbi:MAG TPA: hypothetical protein VKP58_06175 [Candidatus Acidoferrum sp.]|nr:hypothetical protein [Candidatus Acidoferrum sp.]